MLAYGCEARFATRLCEGTLLYEYLVHTYWSQYKVLRSVVLTYVPYHSFAWYPALYNREYSFE